MSKELKLNFNSSIDSRNFISFCFPSNAQLEDKGELNEWLERMMFLSADLEWLLSVTTDKFWSQILFDPSWKKCFDSFLQYAPRSYDLRNIPENCKASLSKISKLFLLVIKRMSIISDEPNAKMKREMHGEIIYENFVFDAAKLLDICCIYYRPETNVFNFLQEAVKNVFLSQPKYFIDISNAVESMVMVLQNMEESLLKRKLIPCSSLKPVHGREAQNMVLLLFDMTKTVHSFLSVFQESSKVFFNSTFLTMLISVCENTLPSLMQLIEIRLGKYKYISTKILQSTAKFVQMTIENGFLRQSKDNLNDGQLFSEYTAIMDSMAQCPRFLSIYCDLGTIQRELDTVANFDNIDISSLQYIKDMVCSSAQENLGNMVFRQLKEILPTKSDTYINSCIQTCGPDVGVIMNNVMEGKVPNLEDVAKEVKAKKINIPNKEILEDNRDHVALLKATFLQENDNYDDEYDDTYDAQDIAARDYDDYADELVYGRKFTIPEILRQAGDVSSESSGEEDAQFSENTINKDGISAENPDKQSGVKNLNNQDEKRASANIRGKRSGGKESEKNREEHNSTRIPGGRENAARGTYNNRGRGRGANKRNHRTMADNKRSKGMMPF